MIISDLSHLEVVEENIVGGINDDYDSQYESFTEYININKYFNSYSSVYGNSAFAEGDAVAYGEDSSAQALSSTYTDDYFSSASATSSSQSDNGYWC